MKTALIYTFSFFALFLTACAKDKIPGIYRIDVHQGNDITQEMVSQLKPGMTKSQVAYVMGTPLIVDTFHPHRWDYIYSVLHGNSQREQRRITVYFNGETLDYLDGDIHTVAIKDMPDVLQVDSDVIVPLTTKKTGLIQDIKVKMGMDDDEVEDTMEKVDLFEDRPVPVPTQSKDLKKRLSNAINDDAQKQTEQQQPGFLKRIIGIGDEETVE